MKFLLIILFLIIKLTATTCCDGSYSSSTGKGTCSHHGGICNSSYTSVTPTPSIPESLQLSCENNNKLLSLGWGYTSNTTSYQIYYSDSCDNSYYYLDTVYTGSYSTSSLGTCNACFKIKSCNSSACSSYSNIVRGENSSILNYSSSSVEVVDGDTIKFDDMTCRLYGIDTPETYYTDKLYSDIDMCKIDENIMISAGKEAEKFVKNVIQNQALEVLTLGKDLYGRDLCIVKFSDGTSLNELLIREGYAIAWENYIDDESLLNIYTNLERNAKNSLKGLWNDYITVIGCLAEEKPILNNPQNVTTIDNNISNVPENVTTIDNNISNGNIENVPENVTTIDNNISNGNIENVTTTDNNISNSNVENMPTNVTTKIINATSSKQLLEDMFIGINNDLNLSYKVIDINGSVLVSHDINSSLARLEFTQAVDKNTLKYYVGDVAQFIIKYYQSSFISIQHKIGSKFVNDINITNDSQLSIDNESETKSLLIIYFSTNPITF
ncbi:MAG: thermonuclease family protein [Sulfurimonas sp.]|jgi:micrococcal nuclease